MTSVVFVTIADIAGRAGDSVATRELLIALADQSDDPVDIICPEPKQEIPPEIEETINDVYYLPPKRGSGHPKWHLKSEYLILKYLLQIRAYGSPRQVITRLYPSTISPLIYCKAFDVKYTVLVRGWVNRTHKGEQMDYHRLIEHVIKWNVRAADKVYVAFGALRDWLTDYRGADRSPIDILPNAVDPSLFSPTNGQKVRMKLGLDKSDFVVGFVGSLEPRHMVGKLIRGAAKTDAHLVIVGDGPEREQLRHLSEEVNISDKVYFTGFVPHQEVPAYISAFDVGYGVVHPDRPSNPIKCYEYLACGKPVITSSVPELQFVKHNQCGVTLDDVSDDIVASAIDKLSSLSQQEYEMMGDNGQMYVVDNCTWSSVATEILDSEA